MSQQEFDSYLALLCRLLRIAPQQREKVAEEFRTHMEDRLEELLAAGMPREKAVEQAIGEFGDAAGLAAELLKIQQGRRKRWIMRLSAATAICAILATLLGVALLTGRQQVPVIATLQAQQPPVEKSAEKPKAASVDTPEARIEQALRTPLDLKFEEESLDKVVAFLQESTNLPVLIQRKKLEEASISTDTPITFHVKGISLKSGLRLMFSELGLTYVVEDEVIQITTREDADSRLEVRVYDCRDLLNLPEIKGRSPRVAAGGGFGPAPGTSEPKDPKIKESQAENPNGGRELHSDLVSVVMSAVSPDSWEEIGGPGTAREYKGMLVVLQTSENHDKVEKLLNQMYSAANLDAKVKVSR